MTKTKKTKPIRRKYPLNPEEQAEKKLFKTLKRMGLA